MDSITYTIYFSMYIFSVLLRQNPHNVHEWHKRVKLFEGKPREVCTVPVH